MKRSLEQPTTRGESRAWRTASLGSLCSLVFAAAVGCSTSSARFSSSPGPAETAAEIEDARGLYELGDFKTAAQKLRGILQAEPGNRKARYYLTLVEETELANSYRRPRGYHQTIPQQPIY